jgi:gamma-glutamyltranspeptidase/glutathione hydrolase
MRAATYLLCATLASPAFAVDPLQESEAVFHPVRGAGGMAATQETRATESAIAILARGGNAVDAAVTAAFTMAVTLPRAGNLGGGGFLLVHLADGGDFAIEFRERAPLAARPDLFLDENGKRDPAKAQSGPLSVGVPGSVRGLGLALETYGTIPLAEAVAPALLLAAKGFPVNADLHDSLSTYREDLARCPEARRIFLTADGEPPAIGTLLVQTDLAHTLSLLAEQGADAFYTGVIAERFATDMAHRGGLITREDLASYRAIVRKPLRSTYRDHIVLTPPPPSSGGVQLLEMLNLVERFPLREFGPNSAASIHVLAEAMKLAHADRAGYLADPDFVEVPTARLISKEYAAIRSALIDPGKTRPSSEIAPGLTDFSRPESHETTHLSVIDAAGNAVSLTTTLNFSYGARIIAAGTGIFLNNQMDMFDAKPGEANAYGLRSGEHNAIAPGKRMISSMAPVLVFFPENSGILATGTPGGSRIANTNLQILVNLIDHGMNLAEATCSPRFHHQWWPDRLEVERGVSPDTLQLLEGKGHHFDITRSMGSVQSVFFHKGTFEGFSDPRRAGALTLPARDQ